MSETSRCPGCFAELVEPGPCPTCGHGAALVGVAETAVEPAGMMPLPGESKAETPQPAPDPEPAPISEPEGEGPVAVETRADASAAPPAEDVMALPGQGSEEEATPLAEVVMALPGDAPTATPLPDAEPLPDAPSGGFKTDPTAKPPLPEPDLPVLLVWPLLIAMIAAFLELMADGPMASIGRTSLENAGALKAGLLDTFGQDWWRLLHASFLHSKLWGLFVTGFLVLFLGASVERRAGGGLLLFLFLGVGAGLNALRVELDPMTLHKLAGGWTGGLALGGAALALASRARQSTGHIVALILFELAILLFLAHVESILTWRLGAVIGTSIGAGLLVGSVWPRGEGRLPLGCLLILVSLAAVGLAEQQRQKSGVSKPPPPWQKPEERKRRYQEQLKLTSRQLTHLRIGLELPANWDEVPQRRTRKCPECDRRMTFPAPKPGPPPKDPLTKHCVQCNEEVFAPPPTQVFFREPGLFAQPRTLYVWCAKKGPYDDPDTLAERIMDQFRGPGSSFRQVELVEEGFFPNARMGQGYRFSIRGQGRQQGSSAVLLRMYVFVGERRTVFLRFMATARTNPLDREEDEALFDSIGQSVRPLPKKRKKRKKKKKKKKRE